MAKGRVNAWQPLSQACHDSRWLFPVARSEASEQQPKIRLRQRVGTHLPPSSVTTFPANCIASRIATYSPTACRSLNMAPPIQITRIDTRHDNVHQALD